MSEVRRYRINPGYAMEPVCCCNWKSSQALSFWFIVQIVNSSLMIARNIYVSSICDESCQESSYFNNTVQLKIEQDGIIRTSQVEEYYFWSDYTKFIAKNLFLTVSIRSAEWTIEVLTILILTGQTRPHKILGRVKIYDKSFTEYIHPSSIIMVSFVEQVFRFVIEIIVFVVDLKNMIEQKERLEKMELNLYFHSYFLHKSYSFVMQTVLILCWPVVIWRLFQYQRFLTRREFEQNQSFGSSSTSFIY